MLYTGQVQSCLSIKKHFYKGRLCGLHAFKSPPKLLSAARTGYYKDSNCHFKINYQFHLDKKDYNILWLLLFIITRERELSQVFPFLSIQQVMKVKVRQCQNNFFKPTYLPKNEQTNSTLLLWYLRLSCFLEEIEDTKETFQN